MVETTGIEPVTPCMSSKYSNQLSYASILKYNSILDLKLQGENDKNSYFLVGCAVIDTFRFCKALNIRGLPDQIVEYFEQMAGIDQFFRKQGQKFQTIGSVSRNVLDIDMLAAVFRNDFQIKLPPVLQQAVNDFTACCFANVFLDDAYIFACFHGKAPPSHFRCAFSIINESRGTDR